LEVVERVFPEHEWSHGIPYPNLVVLAGQIEEYVAVARAIRMVGEARVLAKRTERIASVVQVYLDALQTPSTDVSELYEAAGDMDDVSLAPRFTQYTVNSISRDSGSPAYSSCLCV
jgi:hypothetical protein